ncbi:MAG: hypothetical protein IT459_01555 [Planctomycetes bacterium]|nr:hypothetical protein [Planctomycetota bacterium]
MRPHAVLALPLFLTFLPMVAEGRGLTAADLKVFQAPFKASLATQKATLKAERAIWLAAVAEYETGLKSLGPSDSALANLCQKTATFIGNVRHAGRAATIAIGAELPSFLIPFGPVAASEPLMKQAIGMGTGGAFDAFRAKVAKSESKELNLVASRMRRIAKKCEKAGLAVSVVVERAVRATPVTIEYGSASWFTNVEPSIDFMVAWSHLGVEGDGRLFVAGSAPKSLGSVGISLSGQPADDKFASIDSNTQRWNELFLIGIVEASTKLSLTTPSGPLFAMSGIQVR